MDEALKWADLAAKFGGFIAVFFSGLIGWVVWSARKEMVTKTEFTDFKAEHAAEHEALDGRLNEGDVRFAKLDETLKHMPTRDDVTKLQIDMERLSGDIRVATAILKEVKHPVGLMVENAMQGGNQ